MTSPGTPATRPRPWLGVAIVVAAVLQVVLVNFWPRFASPNEWGRVYQALAVVKRGSLEIGAEAARFGGMEDLAVVRGRTFPNKAPGMLPLLLPAAAAACALAGPDPVAELRLTLVLGRLLAASLPFLVTLLLLARWTSKRYPRGGPVAVASYAVASPALAASLLLFSHALAACLLLAAFTLLFGPPRPRWPGVLLAGFLLAWAATCEYPAALPAAVLALAALPRLGVRGAIAGLAGGAVPAALLGAYDAACFGSPFAISTSHESYAAFAKLVRHGFFGISLPSFAGLAGLLASPARGLLVWAPLAALGVSGALRRGGPPGEGSGRFALAASSLSLLVAMSGYPNWHGGWFPGPRYLLAVLPLLFILVAGGAERFAWRASGRVAVAAAALWGWLQVWPVIASFPFPPEDYPLPFTTLARPLLAEGIVAPSRLPRGAELAVLAVLAALAASALLLLATRGGTRAERLGAAGVALVLAALVVNVRPPATWQAALEGAVIRDVYAGAGKGALEALAARADTPARRAVLESWIARRDAPR